MRKRRGNEARRQSAGRRSPWRWLGGAALLAGLLAVWLADGPAAPWRQGAAAVPPPAASDDATGRRLVWDETRWDFGRVPYNQQVSHDFGYRNVGDAPVTIHVRPIVEIVEGC